ncbi:MAG: TonB-dependent receptor [Novosphingobium sp.]|nr:TonB-dependent receptor [Novosphingobium sp.]MCP5403871.1 TonB-dependent receptor [Novosphingobium sp.]
MKKSAYLTGAALIQAISLPAYAQGTGSESPAASDADVIIVTARRQEERLQDVPISITVLDQEAVAKRNIYNAGDLGAYVPSLSTNANFGPEKSSFAIRGFIQEGRTSPSVGVYFADVVAPRANTGTTSGNGAGVGSFFDLQNVQVLKGPQGTLFGRNTTGGAILLVPAKPTDRLEGYVEGSLGNFDLRRVQGVLNVPLADTFRVRVAMDRHKRDGYLRNRSGVGPDRLGDTDYFAARLSIVADLTPDLENYTIFRYSKSDTNGNIPKVVAAPASPLGYADYPYDLASLQPLLGPLAGLQIARAQARGDGFWDVDNSLPDPRSVQETWQVINTTTWEASDTLTVKNIVSYAEFTEDLAFSLFGDNFLYPEGLLGFPHPAGRFPVINLKSGATGLYAQQSTFTEELQLIGTAADGRLNWQAGAYLEISKPLNFNSAYNEIFLACDDPGALQCTNNILGFGTIFAANIKNFFNNKGFYAQATYDLNDRFAITGGIRYTIDKMRDTSRNINYSPATGTFFCQNIQVFNDGPDLQNAIPVQVGSLNDPGCENTLRIKSKRPTWLINLDYKPTDDVLLYAKWARGYRQGTIISSNVGLETTGPEKVDTYEIGAKTSFGGAFSGYFNVAAFYNDFRDQQLAASAVVAPDFIGIIPPSQVIINAGKSRIWGIEVDASARLFEGFKIDAAYAYLNTKLKSVNPPPTPIFFSELVPVASAGEPLAQSPKNRLTVTGTYTLPLDESIGDISFGATFTHTDANKIHDQRLTPTLFRVKSTQLLNLNAEWASIMGQPIDLAFFMTNATNQKRLIYPISAYPTVGAELGYLNVPRMWGFRLKYRFGE